MGNSLKLGILGGTFDPIHTGHLIVAETARQQFALDRIVFIPAGIPPHKLVKKLALPKDRFEMVKLAICDNPYFDVSTYEQDRDNISYTVDTLSELKIVYPNDTLFYFIIGVDSLLELKSWRNPSKLFSMCSILVYLRPGFDSERAFEEAEFIKIQYKTNVEFIIGPLIDISSTLVRKMIIKNMSIKYVVPDSVEEYIRKNSLYREE